MPPQREEPVRMRTADSTPIDFALVATTIARTAARNSQIFDADVAISALLAAALPTIRGHMALVLAPGHGVIASASTEVLGLEIASQERRSLIQIAQNALATSKSSARAEAFDDSASESGSARAALYAAPLIKNGETVGALAIALPHIRVAQADAAEGIDLLRDCLADMLQTLNFAPKPVKHAPAIAGRLHRALAGHSEGIALFGRNGGLLTANAAFAEAHGADSKALKGLTLEEILQRNHDGFGPLLLARDIRDPDDEGAELALAANGEWLRLARQRTSAGDELIVQSPAGGEITAAAHARKRLKALEAEDKTHRAAWNALSLGALILAKSGRVSDCNDAAAAMLGIKPEAIIGRRVGRLGHLALDDLPNGDLPDDNTGTSSAWRPVGKARTGDAKLVARARTFGNGQILVLLAPATEFTGAGRSKSTGVDRGTDSAATAAIHALGELGHEMRTPLNAVLGFTDVLLAKSFGSINDRQTEYLQDIATAGQHMLEMVDNLLDHARLTAGRYEIEPTWRPVDSLLSDVARLMQPIAEKAEVRIQVRQARPFELNIDRHAYFQVLINLLANALKFTPPGGRVTLSTSTGSDGFGIHIEDTGDGISPAMLDQVTKPFTQARRTGGRALKGAGLGLSIAEALIDLHDGRLTIESELGKGTKVTILTPSARVRAATTN